MLFEDGLGGEAGYVEHRSSAFESPTQRKPMKLWKEFQQPHLGRESGWQLFIRVLIFANRVRANRTKSCFRSEYRTDVLLQLAPSKYLQVTTVNNAE
jgi:hypothetical protein